MDAVVLVQKGAPNDVLLGTDVQPQLGFSLLMATSEKRVDLLVGEGPMVWMEGVGRKDREDMPVSPVEKEEGVSTDEALGRSQPDVGTGQENAKGLDGVVRLLHGTRIPPGYQKLVRASVNRELEKCLMLFTPQVDQPDLVMEDSAVEVREETYVTLVVQNHGMEPVQLDSGMRLGEVVPIELVEREMG